MVSIETNVELCVNLLKGGERNGGKGKHCPLRDSQWIGIEAGLGLEPWEVGSLSALGGSVGGTVYTGCVGLKGDRCYLGHNVLDTERVDCYDNCPVYEAARLAYTASGKGGGSGGADEKIVV